MASTWMQLMGQQPIQSKQQMPSDDVPRQLLTLVVELLRSRELPELAIAGAWRSVRECLEGRPGLAAAEMELLFELGMEHLRAIGSPADVVSIARGKAGRASGVLEGAYGVTRGFAGQWQLVARAQPSLCLTPS